MKMAVVTFPNNRNTSALRGQALMYWIQTHKDPATGQFWNQTTFADYSGIKRANLTRYLAGAADLANMEQDMVERLLGAMGMSDLAARDYFGIPEGAWVRWRTFRPAPLGHGADPEDSPLRAMPLTTPLKGDVTAPAGHILKVNPQQLTGLVVVRVGSDYWVMQRETPEAPLPGEFVGGFVNVGVG